MLVFGQHSGRCGALFATAHHDKTNHQQATEQQTGRAEPKQPGAGVEAGFVTNEVTVAVDHKIDDLLVALPFAQHAVDFLAQVGSNRRIGVGDVLILAFGATQLAGQLAVAGALGVVTKGVGVDGRVGDAAQQQVEQNHAQAALHGRPSSSSA